MLALFLLLWYPLLTIVRGLSIAVFWNWFIAGPGAPFEGSAPMLTTIQALGLSLVVGFLTYEFNSNDDDDKDATEIIVAAGVKIVVLYAMYWTIALIYHAILV